MPDEYLTVAEIAETLKLNQQTVRNWIDAGKLPALHVGRSVRVKRADFERLLGQGYSSEVRSESSPEVSIWDGEIPSPELP